MKKIMLTMAILTMLLPSCKESILDVKNENAYSDATYFKEAAQFNEAVIATYATLLQNGMYAREWYFTFDLLANDAERSIALLGDLQQMSEFTHGTGHPQVTNTWQTLYRMIFRANVVLDKSAGWNPASTDDKNSKNLYIAEAKFLRGYAYFQIVNLWGRAPLKTEKNLSDLYPKRAPKEDIWKQAEQDFKDAAAGLPNKQSADNLGRATKGAALSMLGKVYLYQKNYDEAIKQFEAVAALGYDLNKSYDEQFTNKNSGSVESVFDVPHRWFGWGTNGANQYYMFGGQEAWGGQTTHTGRAQEYGFNDWNNVYISDALVAAYTYKNEAGAKYIDPRAAKVFYGNKASGGDTTYCDACKTGKISYDYDAAGFKWRKYEPYEEIEKIDGPQSEINSQVIRYADVLLMLAESYIFKNDNTKALPLINKVRKRVGAFEYTKLGTQAEAIALLQRERQLELAGEQLRYFDLLRWGVLKATVNAEKNAVRSKYPTLQIDPFKDKHLLFPIPQSEKDANASLSKDITNEWN
jgi:starch-binding outer membrane protein, SusD/RagB family